MPIDFMDKLCSFEESSDYVAPTAKILELLTEGVLCESYYEEEGEW